MQKTTRSVLCLVICASFFLSTRVRADTVFEFTIHENNADQAINQSLFVKAGQVMVKAAGGNRDIDLLYSRAVESVVIVDHRKRTLMTVNEQEVARINKQAKNVQPLLQGFSEQVAKLSPEQRRQWQDLLGDSVSLEKIAKAAEAARPNTLHSMQQTKKVAGISCQEMRLMQGETPMAEICFAESAALKIPVGDEVTLRSLFTLYERIATESQGVARQLGLSLPLGAVTGTSGIPVELRDLSRDENGVITLHKITTARVSPELMTIPAGYKAVPLTLWP